MLSEWPYPYKIARKSESVKRGIAKKLDYLYGRNTEKAVTVFDGHGPAEKTIRDKVFTVSVDCSKSKKMIEEEFGKICEPFLSSRRGRKNKGTPPSIRLKQLAAHRLRNRFIGKGKTFPSYARLVIEIQKKAQGNDPEKILPNYSSESGIAKASDIASVELKRYRYYLFDDPSIKLGSGLIIHPGPDLFGLDWDGELKCFLKKPF